MEERVAKLEVRVDNLEKWQTLQNKTLEKIERALHTNNRWLIGLLGGIIVALIMQVIGLIT